MSAQRMTARSDLTRFGRQLRLAAGLLALAIPLSGCGTGSLWDKFMAKDDTFNEEPADKLYNEGLYLMNQRKDNEGGVEEVRGSRPPASLFRLGAQIAADVGLFLLQCRRLRQLHRRRDPLRHAASRQLRRRLRAISDRGLALRPDSGHFPRSGPHREGHRRARGSDSQISDVGICQQRQGQARGRAGPAGRQGNDSRPLLHGKARLHRARSTGSRPS